MWTDLAGFAVGFLLAAVAAPVGVSGAVFLLPVQISVFAVPSPAVTPTNLLFNVISLPGALLRYLRGGRLRDPLVGQLLAGTLPGVVAGAVVRVYLLPGAALFRVLAGVLLLAIGGWLAARTWRPGTARVGSLGPRTITGLAAVTGLIGGVYGIGGGSILGPILAGSGLALARVAPAALASTFVTSLVGVATYAVLAIGSPHPAAPDWALGISCGLGGLLGGYLGARLQPRLPERGLRTLLSAVAIAVGLTYLATASMP